MSSCLPSFSSVFPMMNCKHASELLFDVAEQREGQKGRGSKSVMQAQLLQLQMQIQIQIHLKIRIAMHPVQASSIFCKLTLCLCNDSYHTQHDVSVSVCLCVASWTHSPAHCLFALHFHFECISRAICSCFCCCCSVAATRRSWIIKKKLLLLTQDTYEIQ